MPIFYIILLNQWFLFHSKHSSSLKNLVFKNDRTDKRNYDCLSTHWKRRFNGRGWLGSYGRLRDSIRNNGIRIFELYNANDMIVISSAYLHNYA